MRTYYNDSDRHCAGWLRNLAAAGLVRSGTVDDRSILEVQPADLAGYERAHFFAGIGLWDYTLQLAGWTGPVWTASCPCQPFSVAGQQRAHLDERHLWPALYRLIAQCRPPAVFGEQIAGKLGGTWVAAVRHDLEGLGYRVGIAGLPACSVGAPHIRARVYWCAIRMDDTDIGQCERTQPGTEGGGESELGCGTGGLADATRGGWREKRPDSAGGDKRGAASGGEQRPGHDDAIGPWSKLEWIACRDGKWRPAQSGIFPLAPRNPGDVAKLRAYGNAIVPQVAAEFVRAVMECL